MDLHRHDEASTFDGFGKPSELAQLAKELGHTALGISNHGNTTNLVKHYKACKEAGIKPVLGVEGYFLPMYKEQERGFHLCLFAKNHTGYRNINILQYEGDKQRYYNPIWTFDLLEKYHDGLICTSACVEGYLAKCIASDKMGKAKKFVEKMVDIFGDDFYIEVQPYRVTDKGLQERVNLGAIEIAKELGVKCILTSDSHRGRKEDLDTYLKMHEIAGHDMPDIEETYAERYMPTDSELYGRFYNMHCDDFKEMTADIGQRMIDNLAEIEGKVDDDIFSGLTQLLPKLGDDSDKLVFKKIKGGLVEKGKWTKNHPETGLNYITRAKEEFEVIKTLGFSDYFLIVSDYVGWAKENGIVVGPGRGSVCNSLVAYAMGITEVDSLLFGLDFRRFLRKDKKNFPDVDLDFETARRDEVINYVIKKYPGRTARVASYGLYKADSLINDLAKVSGLPIDKDVEQSVARQNKQTITNIKALCNTYINDSGELDTEKLLAHPMAIEFNTKYDNIVKHFTKLYMKLRYIGTHAAGVAVTGGDMLDYTALKADKTGQLYTSYDLNDLDEINLVKFDMLGLGTMEEIGELRKATGVTVDYDKVVHDEEILSRFGKGDTKTVFQFDRKSVRDMLVEIKCNSFQDIVAANAMNRPGPLSSGMPESYAINKDVEQMAKDSPLYDYTRDSYGTVIYQEQIQQICVYVGGMEWKDADKVMKMDVGKLNAHALEANKERDRLKELFCTGAVQKGFSQDDAEDMFHAMEVYSFNKGHATGYSLISVEEMFYKVYHPTDFWYCKIKYSHTDADFDKFCALAVNDGCVVFLPHINYSGIKTRKRKVEGEWCLQQGIQDIKGIGDKAAEAIVKERKRGGVFVSWDDFVDRCQCRAVNVKVLRAIKECGAGTFDKQEYISRVTKYNTALYGRELGK